MSMNGDLQKVIEAAKKQGWRHRKMENGHHQLLAPNGKDIVHASGTASDHRAFSNFMSQMRRAGYRPFGDVMTTTLGDAMQEAREKAAAKGLVAQKKSAAVVIIELLTEHPVGASTAEMIERFRTARPDVTDHTSNVSGAVHRLKEQQQIVKIAHGKYRLPGRCAWFGEGRGQCTLKEEHRGEHVCEEDERLARETTPPPTPQPPPPAPSLVPAPIVVPTPVPKDVDKELNAAMDMVLEGVARIQQLLHEHRESRVMVERMRELFTSAKGGV